MLNKSFKIKPRKPLKRSRIRVVGHSTSAELKMEIQHLLREIVLIRDGGCIMRHYPQTGKCGDYRKDGQLILQAEHLNSRQHAISFSDSRLVVCLCKRHHIYYKKQYPDEFYRIVREHIGPVRSDLLTRVQNDWTPYKTDLKLDKLALENELNKLLTNNHE